MNEPATAGEPRASRPDDEPSADASPIRRRRRIRLRYQTAVVVAELQRMRRTGWSEAGEGAAPRLVA